jgi:hypothetical protein
MNAKKPIFTVFVVSIYLLSIISISLSSVEELYAQQRSTISVTQATALPLVITEGNQVKLIINYSIGDESIVGQKINAIMGIYDRINGTLIKLSSFPDGIVLNNTAGMIQLASTLTDPMIQNISTIVTLTNAQKTEKYSNDVRSDLDFSAILPTSLPGLALSETSVPPPSPPPSLPSPAPTVNNEDQETDNSDDNDNSDSDDE